MIGDYQFYLSILLKLFKFAKYVCGIFSFRKINLRKAAEKHYISPFSGKSICISHVLRFQILSYWKRRKNRKPISQTLKGLSTRYNFAKDCNSEAQFLSTSSPLLSKSSRHLEKEEHHLESLLK